MTPADRRAATEGSSNRRTGDAGFAGECPRNGGLSHLTSVRPTCPGRRAGRSTFPDNWRIYARSAGDDKGPIQAFMSAMDAIGGKPTQSIKVILHGEEEGSGRARFRHQKPR